jgi:tetratricopeptide (TPR) repeat protein
MNESQRRCFVVMGFGVKTDYTTGRKLDLNKSYQYLIKPVLKEKGWVCVRADEIPNSGSIDLQMYLELLQADVVIADLSTLNANAIYELGIRHALRPFTTIIIAEDKLVYPFDLSHISITKYTHLGDSIDYGEAERFHGVLNALLDAAIDQKPPPKDSPVYTYISDLVPPSIQDNIDQMISRTRAAISTSLHPAAEEVSSKTLSILCDEGEDALKNKKYADAKSIFKAALELGKVGNSDFAANDPYLVQRLALATSKAGEPDMVTALKDALQLLNQLGLDHTNDPETVALAGSFEKKLYEQGQGDEHLKNAILFNERGYFLLNNRYNGINLAYTFNCRVDSNLYTRKEDKVADMVFANRVRTRVLMICGWDWEAIVQRESAEVANTVTLKAEDAQKQTVYNDEQKFWILVNKAEAHFGLGEFDAYREAIEEAKKFPHTDWMFQSFNEQISKLHLLLSKHGHLLETPWVYKET